MSLSAWLMLGLMLAIGGGLVWLYNRMVRQRNVVNEAWAGIDVQLQKRHELVPNLVQTVRGYTRHESDLLENVTRLRGRSDADVGTTIRDESQLSRGLSVLFAVAEDYPELKASEGFQQLHRSLVEIENQLQFARRYYNGAVRDNNNLVESFPARLVAQAFGFPVRDFFEIEYASQRSAPTVELDAGR